MSVDGIHAGHIRPPAPKSTASLLTQYAGAHLAQSPARSTRPGACIQKQRAFDAGNDGHHDMLIRRHEAGDWPAVWALLHETFRDGDTYAFAPDSPEAEIRRVWIETPLATYVARGPDGTLLGTYYLKANQPGLGAHVCNCGYVVARAAQGQGVATAMCEHSQHEARELGFRAMQFNLVVSTNVRAVQLWQRLGFAIVGTLPKAFCHLRLGEVDAHVMYKRLVD